MELARKIRLSDLDWSLAAIKSYVEKVGMIWIECWINGSLC